MKVAKYILFLIVLCCTSCQEAKVARMLRDFSKSEIVFPSDLVQVRGKSVMQNTLPNDKPLMVFYHDTLECGTCRINHLRDYNSVYKLSDSLGTFEVITVFSPRMDDALDIYQELIDYNFEYPVYLDFYEEFCKANNCIPSDRRFHSFLLDAQRHPILVGDPISSDRMWDMFEKVVRGF